MTSAGRKFTWESRFAIGTKVVIDDDDSIIGIVTAIQLRGNGITYEVSYIHNGAANSPLIEEFRLHFASP